MEARSSGAERSVRTKRSGRMSVSEGWNARPERSEGNARKQTLDFYFFCHYPFSCNNKSYNNTFIKILGGNYGTSRGCVLS